MGEILLSAESIFKAMKNRDFPGIWSVLSEASRSSIIRETSASIIRSGGKEVATEDLRKDFVEGGPVATDYWNGFLEHFDPDLALEQSKWEKGSIGGERAEIRLTYRNAERPALLLMFREKGAWKVGLIETFGARK
ncbi:MAG: hypothetical protein ACM31N_08745 [Deltaproteobacteria bacterium]